jgi:glycine/D-amino acid oxidase-like deaminating enzyme
MKRDMDVLVIGGVAINTCSAYYLARQGLRVSSVEKGEIASGCSGANAGLMVPSYSTRALAGDQIQKKSLILPCCLRSLGMTQD